MSSKMQSGSIRGGGDCLNDASYAVLFMLFFYSTDHTERQIELFSIPYMQFIVEAYKVQDPQPDFFASERPKIDTDIWHMQNRRECLAFFSSFFYCRRLRPNYK